MKQLLCLLLCCMLLVLPACAEEASVNSWSQINQAVSKGADWQQADTDGRFHLGEKKPLAIGAPIPAWMAAQCACPWLWSWHGNGWVWRKAT